MLDVKGLEHFLLDNRSTTSANFHFLTQLLLFGPFGLILAIPVLTLSALTFSILLYSVLFVVFYVLAASLFLVLFVGSLMATSGVNLLSGLFVAFVSPFIVYPFLLFLIYDRPYCDGIIQSVYGENNVLDISGVTRCQLLFDWRNTVHTVFVTWIIVVILIVSEGVGGLLGIETGLFDSNTEDTAEGQGGGKTVDEWVTTILQNI